MVVVLVPVVVVLSGKHGGTVDWPTGVGVVDGATPPTTSPPRIQAVLAHSNGAGHHVGRSQPHGGKVVVVGAVVDDVVYGAAVVPIGS